MKDFKRIKEYAETGSQQAFSELVERYTGLVYSVCMRRLGDHHLAEEGTQAVFIALARKAPSISRNIIISGWLVKATFYACEKIRRREKRRAKNEEKAAVEKHTYDEKEAWREAAPFLDQGLMTLREPYRDALVLRYYCGMSNEEAAEAMGVNTPAAAMRIKRGLKKMRKFFSKKDIHYPVAALGTIIEKNHARFVPPDISGECMKAVTAAISGNGAAYADAITISQGVTKMIYWAKVKVAAAFVCTVLAGMTVIGTAGVLAAGKSGQPETEKIVRKGPLKDLPSEPEGEHLAKINNLGDNEWVDLGSPAPDPKWGKARGRSWGCRAPYAADLNGAFFFGEGKHGFIKPNGHYMDDLWFYDAGQHRWICVYPGIHAAEGYKEISFDKETGFEVTPDGQPIPIASMTHAYTAITYDSDRGLFMNHSCPGKHWKPGYYKGIKGRVEAIEAHKKAVKKAKEEGNPPPWAGKGTSPYIYNTRTGRFERYRTEHPGSPGGYGTQLTYVPSVKKAFGYKNKNGRVAWYNPDTHDWEYIKKKGNIPPFHIDIQVTYDSKRDRLYIAGGGYPHIDLKPGDSALWMFDVKTETFSRLVPKETPTPTSYASNGAIFEYDSVNDVVLLFWHTPGRGRDKEKAIYAYHPETNEWEVVAENVSEMKRGRYAQWSGHYNPKLNVFLLHAADDSRNNGTMLAYRYKRKK